MNETEDELFSRRCYYISLGCLTILGLASFIMNVFDLHLEGSVPKHDLFYTLTGYYCPGCGGTRALEALLHGHFLQCFLYHPAVFYTALMLFLYAFTNALRRAVLRLTASHRISERTSALLRKIPCMGFRPGYFYVLIAIILLQWIAKNAIYFFTGIHVI